MDMSQYLEIFIDESKEHLQHMNEILLTLENQPDNLALLNEIFRIAHTIKGMAGTMGFNKLANLTHEMENVLDLVRNRQIDVTSYIVDILFECFDSLEEYITNLTNTGQEGELDSTELVKKLSDLVETKGKGTVAVTKVVNDTVEEKNESVEIDEDFHISITDIEDIIGEAVNQGLNPFLIKVILDEGCMLKAARSFIVFNTLEQFGEIIKSYPIAEEIEDEKFDREFEVLYLSKMDETTTHNEIMRISEISDVKIKSFDLEKYKVEEVVIEDVEIDLSTVDQSPVDVPKPAATQQTKTEKPKTAKTVRVDIARLDTLMNLVSELIIIKTRLEDNENNSSQNTDDAVEYLERITTSLHDAVMKVRMVPVERTFNRFPRMVRDLSKDLGKEIKLFMSGEDTEVDRTVIDEIGDPLIHLIRNSIDHGIEGPEERASKNKPSAGTVALRAYPDGNTVVIEVEDDGAGIDPEKIKAIALRKGLATESEVDAMSNQDIINMLFRAGFSTAEKVTDLSGRGVGLDVVKTKIESLNGSVEVHSNMGEGSKFVIRLPLTLAIIQALMVNLGAEKYAIPLNNIKEITTIKKADLTLVQNQEVVLYRNNTLPILRLGDILEVDQSEVDNSSDEMVVVIVKKGETEAGLVVNSLIGQQEIVIKSLGKYLTGIKVIAGATILGNGGVALIIDPNQLF